MIANRSAPKATVVPILVYEDVGKALEFLTSQNIRDVDPSEWGAKVAR